MSARLPAQPQAGSLAHSYPSRWPHRPEEVAPRPGVLHHVIFRHLDNTFDLQHLRAAAKGTGAPLRPQPGQEGLWGVCTMLAGGRVGGRTKFGLAGGLDFGARLGLRAGFRASLPALAGRV